MTINPRPRPLTTTDYFFLLDEVDDDPPPNNCCTTTTRDGSGLHAAPNGARTRTLNPTLIVTRTRPLR